MYLLIFSITFVLSVILTRFVGIVMKRLKVVDKPLKNSRKIHKNRVPLGGGLAIFISFFTFYYDINIKQLLGIFIGGIILVTGGFLDDKYVLKARYQLIFPILAALVAVFFGIGTDTVTNPLGGSIELNFFKIGIEQFDNLLLFSDLLVFFWLFGVMFTTKFLDGLDGLVAGIVCVGSLMIFFLSTQAQWYQPEVAVLSIVFTGAVAGFLIWNWHPAKIFLGEGGSLLTGYILGILAVISGGKIATTLLVIGIPMLDMVRVFIRRIPD